jgi:hypothetical protein
MIRKIWSVNHNFYIDPRTKCLVNTPYCPCTYSVIVYPQSHINCVEIYYDICGNYGFGYGNLLSGIKRTDEEGNDYLFYSLVGLMPCRLGCRSSIVYARWRSGHSPYPNVDKMTIDICGIRVLDNEHVPKAPDDPMHLSYLYRYSDGSLYVGSTPVTPPEEDSLQ